METALRRSARIQESNQLKGNRISSLPLELRSMICEFLPQAELTRLCRVNRVYYHTITPLLYGRGIFQFNISKTNHIDPKIPVCNGVFVRKLTKIRYRSSWERIQNVSFHINMSPKKHNPRDEIAQYVPKDFKSINKFSGANTVRDTCHIVIDATGATYLPVSTDNNYKTVMPPVLQAIKGLVGFRTLRVELAETTMNDIPPSGYGELHPEDFESIKEALESSLGPSTFWKHQHLSENGKHTGIEFHPYEFSRQKSAEKHTVEPNNNNIPIAPTGLPTQIDRLTFDMHLYRSDAIWYWHDRFWPIEQEWVRVAHEELEQENRDPYENRTKPKSLGSGNWHPVPSAERWANQRHIDKPKNMQELGINVGLQLRGAPARPPPPSPPVFRSIHLTSRENRRQTFRTNHLTSPHLYEYLYFPSKPTSIKSLVAKDYTSTSLLPSAEASSRLQFIAPTSGLFPSDREGTYLENPEHLPYYQSTVCGSLPQHLPVKAFHRLLPFGSTTTLVTEAASSSAILAPSTFETYETNDQLIRRLSFEAHQISAFLATKHEFTEGFTSNSHRAVRYFTTTYPKPQNIEPESLLPRARRATPAPAYPNEWVVDKHRFVAAVRSFRLAADLVIPHDYDPTPASSHHRSRSTSAITRNTSVEGEIPRPNLSAGMAGNAGFTEAQRQELQAMFTNFRADLPQQPQRNPSPPPANNGRPAGWRARDIGIFEPKSDGPAVEVKDNHNVYHNVFSFTARLKVKETTINKATLTQNLDDCLLGEADDWYTNQITHASRLGMMYDPTGVTTWCNMLEARFRDPPGKSLSTLETARYTVQDARNRRDPAEYMSTIILNGKNSGIAESEASQVLLAYQHMDGSLRRDVKRPTPTTTVAEMIEELRLLKDIWFDIYANSSVTRSSMAAPNRQSRSDRSAGQYQSRAGNQAFRPGYQSFGNARPYYQNNPAYQSAQYQPRQQDARPLPPLGQAPQRLQITAGPASGSGFQQSARPAYQQNARQPNNQSQGSRYAQQPQRAYQATAEDAPAEDYGDEYDQSGGHWQYDDQPGESFEDGADDERSDPQDVNFVTQPKETVLHRCSKCEVTFNSRNKLFDHLRRTCWSKPSAKTGLSKPSTGSTSSSASMESSAASTPESTSNKDLDDSEIELPQANLVRVSSSVTPSPDKPPGYGFRGWKYATIKVSWIPSDATSSRSSEATDVCLDSGCSVTLIDRAYLKKVLPKAEIKKMSSPMPVRGVGNKIVKTDAYALIRMYVRGTVDGTPAEASILMEVHLVDDLKANLLIGNDTLTPQAMVLDFGKRLLRIGACENLATTIDVHTRSDPNARRTIKTKSAVTILPGSTVKVPVAFNGDIPSDRDFLFEPDCAQDLGPQGGVFAHVVDSDITFVQVYNASPTSVCLPRKARLGSLVEYDQDGAFQAEPAYAPLAVGNTKSWKSTVAKGLLAIATAYSCTLRKPFAGIKDLDASVPQAFSAEPSAAPPSTTSINTSLEHTLPNGIKVYGTNDVAQQFASVVADYPEIFTDQGTTVIVPEEEWMPITLKPDAVVKPARVYPVSQKDKQLIDETFDKLHADGKMEWTSRPTPFSYPVFVVWREVNGQRKGRVVVDIRSLNQATVSDSYPLPLQSDITAAVAGYRYISTMDGVGYFHQFQVKGSDRHKLTVVSHRGQEQYNVALMGYKGSPPYVQRQTDKLLRPYRDFAKAYVDDMIAFSSTLHEHLVHLRKLFQLFRERRLSLNPRKTYLGYPSIALLGQYVDSLGLTTSAEKLEAIQKLRFPSSLRDLEIFLGLTGWLRSSIERYAQRAHPLQQRKTELTAPLSDSKGHARKARSVKAFYEPTKLEFDSFNDLKEAFHRPTFLVHYSSTRPLFVDLDASKAWGLAAVVYHVLGDALTDFPRTSVQPIMFLSKMLNPAELNYWPTELEVAGIVWVVKKIRHMIESSKVPPTIIYTDHSAAVPISKQTSLTSSSTDKLNLRLVRASQYLSQFNLVVKHKAGKSNVVPDALSRLKQATTLNSSNSSSADSVGTLDALCSEAFEELGLRMPTDSPDTPNHCYHITLVEMSATFKQRVAEAYRRDPQWNKVLDLLTDTAAGPLTEADTRLSLRFRLRNNLIYYTNFKDGRERLCIPNTDELEKEVFALAHDKQHHGGFHRSYDRVSASIYMRHLSSRLRAYVEHCPTCQLNRTTRHRPFGSLQPIDSPAIPHHTIAMDFVVALPLTPQGFDALLTVTCKFSKRVLLIPGKSTWSAPEWAEALLAGLMGHDWGVPCAIISDRDSKFMSDFWRTIFERLGCELLTSTAYHAQTDGQSERTNQTVEIGIRYYVSTKPIDSFDWTFVLPYLQGYLNNATNQSTGVAPNEVLVGCKVRDNLSMLADIPAEDYSKLRQLCRDQAEESIAFASAFSKLRYDSKHASLNLNVGDEAYLRLNHGYNIPGLTNHKLHQQRVGPFKILEKIGRLAYKLELPPTMSSIHPTISIAQLEPVPHGQDPYGRTRTQRAVPVAEEGYESDEYEIEALVGKRTSRGKTQYLVKWKNSGHQDNAWYNIDDLGDARKLIHEYEQRPHGKLRSTRHAPRSRSATEAAASRPAPTPPPHPPPPPTPAPQRLLLDAAPAKGSDAMPRRRRGRPRKN